MIDFVVEEGRWLVATLPEPGGDALAKQSRIAGPAKAVAPDLWRVEAPLCKSAEAIVCQAARAVSDQYASAVHVPDAGDQGASEELPAAAFEGLGWELAPAGLVLRVEDSSGSHRVAATRGSGAVYFRSALLRRRVPDSSRDVLAHFILALNARLRLARASFVADGVVLEVALPAAELDGFLVGEAVAALAVGVRLARRECAALLDGWLASQYREFHLLKGEPSCKQ
jgi:hypothetical protein